ncbi:hypothetical protein CHUAL_012634 [Chamberlinius hualienensis]
MMVVVLWEICEDYDDYPGKYKRNYQNMDGLFLPMDKDLHRTIFDIDNIRVHVGFLKNGMMTACKYLDKLATLNFIGFNCKLSCQLGPFFLQSFFSRLHIPKISKLQTSDDSFKTLQLEIQHKGARYVLMNKPSENT